MVCLKEKKNTISLEWIAQIVYDNNENNNEIEIAHVKHWPRLKASFWEFSIFGSQNISSCVIGQCFYERNFIHSILRCSQRGSATTQSQWKREKTMHFPLSKRINFWCFCSRVCHIAHHFRKFDWYSKEAANVRQIFDHFIDRPRSQARKQTSNASV